MARQRTLPKRPTRSRIQTCISGEVHERVDLYCAHYGISEARFFEAAALEKLDGMGDAKTIARQLELMNEQLEIMSEHANLFVQMWMQNTQPLANEERDAARRQMTARYKSFAEQLIKNLSGGRGFLSTFHQRRRKSLLEKRDERDSSSSVAQPAA
jgi:hypothetical protein